MLDRQPWLSENSTLNRMKFRSDHGQQLLQLLLFPPAAPRECPPGTDCSKCRNAVRPIVDDDAISVWPPPTLLLLGGESDSGLKDITRRIVLCVWASARLEAAAESSSVPCTCATRACTAVCEDPSIARAVVSMLSGDDRGTYRRLELALPNGTVTTARCDGIYLTIICRRVPEAELEPVLAKLVKCPRYFSCSW